MKTQPGRTFVIAEAGVNHNGSLALARELVEAAAEAKADAFKIQTFSADKLVLKNAARAIYQERNTKSSATQHEMLKALELDAAAHHELRELCARRGIEFMSTGFHPDDIDFLVRETGISRVKIPSGDATNPVLLQAAWRTGLPIILSTGMCTLEEVLESLSLLAWLARTPAAQPASRAALRELRGGKDWTAPLQARVSLLHCVTQYPAPPASVNLRAMESLMKAARLPVGLSDHSEGWHIATAAVAMGACILEKHYTLSRNMEGPDHAASLEPQELARMIREIRDVEEARGDGVKAPGREECANLVPARGSLVAAQGIRKGEAFTRLNITIKRPGGGVPPHYYWDYIGGMRADRDYSPDDAIVPANPEG